MNKLSLKRKLPQEKHEIKRHKLHTNGASDHGVTDTNSEAEVGKNEVVLEQRESDELSLVAQKKSIFLDTSDPSLNRLRQMILNLAPKDRNISQFPTAYTDQSVCDVDQTASFEQIQDRPPSLSKVHESVELSPFPKVCPHLINSKEKSAASSRRDAFDSPKEFELSDKSHINIGKCKQNITSVTRIDSVTREKRNNVDSTYRENNSNLLRDRNSNLYALQSQNSSLIDSNDSSSNINSIVAERENVSIADQYKNQVVKPNASKHSASDNCIQLETNSKVVIRKYSDSAQDRTRSSKDQSIVDMPQDTMSMTLKNCPLCQTQFSDRQNQIDIDSHIASCLAASDDSVTW